MRTTIDIAKFESASFPQRIIARFIDGIIVFALFLLFLKLAGVKIELDADKSGNVDPTLGVGVWLFLAPLISMAYEIPTMASQGLTIGKRIMGIAVVRTDGLIGIGLDRALIRYFVPFGIGLIPLAGVFLNVAAQGWFIFDPARQNVPDKAARTFVIRLPRQVRTQGATEPDDVIDI